MTHISYTVGSTCTYTGDDLKHVLWPLTKDQGHHRGQSEKAVDLVEAYSRVKPLSGLTKSELYRIVCFNSANICRTETYNLSLEMSP